MLYPYLTEQVIRVVIWYTVNILSSIPVWKISVMVFNLLAILPVLFFLVRDKESVN